MRGNNFLTIGILLFLMGASASCYPARYDGPYKGKIVDAVTGKPIEGVVVLGTWYRSSPSAGGAVHTFYDAMETVTDKKGEFEIKGLGLRILTNIEPMYVLIFKAGYEYIGMYMWETLKLDPRKITWDGNRAIIPLQKLTMEERKKSLGPPAPPDDAAKKKIELMLKEINKDRSEQGLDLIDVGR